VAYGTDDTFAFMNDNPSMTSFPSDYVMDPNIIARNDNMVSVNSIIQVDLTGQCNAEYLAGHMFSGTAAQLDFVRGAMPPRTENPCWRFIQRRKTTPLSRVVPYLDKNAP
jgi:itaconate CoA-transferase